MTTRSCRVDITSSGLGSLYAAVEVGLPPVQAVRVIVTYEHEAKSHVVVGPAMPPWTLPTDEHVLQRMFPDDFVSCVWFDPHGEVILSCGPADELTLFGAAAAIATIKRS